jgi:molybdopterin-guanine dinucleotide biosynthesis protein B
MRRPLRAARCGNDGSPNGLILLGLTGSSGSGKTVLLTAMTRLFVANGLRVATIKHTHHGFDPDQPGKDSFRHREAGASEVLLASDRRWVLFHEVEGPEPTLDVLVSRLEPADVVLVEGFRSSRHAKIEVFRPSLGRPPLWPDRTDILAVATDVPLPYCDKPLLPLNDPSAIVAWMLRLPRTDAAPQRAP